MHDVVGSLLFVWLGVFTALAQHFRDRWIEESPPSAFTGTPRGPEGDSAGAAKYRKRFIWTILIGFVVFVGGLIGFVATG